MILTLFDTSPILPPGFEYMENFISPAEEDALFRFIATMELKPMQFHQYEAKRLVAGFGRSWSFTEKTVKTGMPLPAAFDGLRQKVAEQAKMPAERFEQLLVTKYPPDAVINWHRDAPPYQVLAGVSLLADVNFRLRPHEKAKQVRGNTLSLTVKRRSLYIMRNEAKTAWQHSTSPAKAERVSITFRSLED